jgi:hypothetical protein
MPFALCYNICALACPISLEELIGANLREERSIFDKNGTMEMRIRVNDCTKFT